MHIPGCSGVQAIGGLIQDEDGWIVHQRAGQAELLLHPSRVIHGVLLRRIEEPEADQEVRGAAPSLDTLVPVHFRHELKDLPTAERIWQLDLHSDVGVDDNHRLVHAIDQADDHDRADDHDQADDHDED